MKDERGGGRGCKGCRGAQPPTPCTPGTEGEIAFYGDAKNHTATRQEYERYMWDKRFDKRRKDGVKRFWKQERNRLERGEKGTRNWTREQQDAILSGKKPKFNDESLQAHHSYSATKYPHLANRGEIIYPATHREHHMGWHGGSYKKSLPGKRIRPINEF